MDTIGQRLRSGREDKGASRVDVSHETKIAVHHLAALEYSDFDELPDVVHVKGYVKAYAEYLGLDPTAVLDQFLEEYEAHVPVVGGDPRDEVVRKMSKMLGGPQGHWSKRMRPVLIVGALALIVLLVWAGWGRFGQSETAGAETGSPTVAQSTPPVVEDVAQRPDASGTETTESSGSPSEEGPTETDSADTTRFVVIREPEPETPRPTRSDTASRTVESDSRPPVVAPESVDSTPPQPVVTTKQAESDSPSPVTASKQAASKQVDSTPPPSVAASKPADSKPAPVTHTDARLSITQSGVGTDVENRQLRGESDRFSTGTKVAFFTRVAGGRTGDTIRHVWRHEGNQIASIPLRIGSANWRTYSRKTLYAGSAGVWTVEAVDDAGNVLARSEFHCLP